jgi:hypothetical protein
LGQHALNAAFERRGIAVSGCLGEALPLLAQGVERVAEVPLPASPIESKRLPVQGIRGVPRLGIAGVNLGEKDGCPAIVSPIQRFAGGTIERVGRIREQPRRRNGSRYRICGDDCHGRRLKVGRSHDHFPPARDHREYHTKLHPRHQSAP